MQCPSRQVGLSYLLSDLENVCDADSSSGRETQGVIFRDQSSSLKGGLLSFSSSHREKWFIVKLLSWMYLW